VRPDKNGIPTVRTRHGRVSYAVVDYELLGRTAAHEDAVRQVRRSTYLRRQRDRFLPRAAADYPPELRPAAVLGVPYVYGHCESTKGLLWVVGNDPNLFAYFLPERWRQKRVALSESGRTFYTQTKDRIHLIWKVSRVGEIPSPPPEAQTPTQQAMRQQGYNTPFEKVALALEMTRAGVRTIYPRAIYMTGVGLSAANLPGTPEGLAHRIRDARRFEFFGDILSPDGKPILPMDHDYITLWGYWRGQEDDQATHHDDATWTPIDAAQARAKGIITQELLDAIVARHQADLTRAGFEDLNLKPDHILLSYIPEGPLKYTADGFPELRHCNFELVRKIARKLEVRS